MCFGIFQPEIVGPEASLLPAGCVRRVVGRRPLLVTPGRCVVCGVWDFGCNSRFRKGVELYIDCRVVQEEGRRREGGLSSDGRPPEDSRPLNFEVSVTPLIFIIFFLSKL